jgi:hypothetical protein
MGRIELIRASFHRGAAEIAEGAQRIGFSLRSLGVLGASAVRCSSLSICCGIRQHIYEVESSGSETRTFFYDLLSKVDSTE